MSDNNSLFCSNLINRYFECIRINITVFGKERGVVMCDHIKTYIDNTSFSLKVSDQSWMIHWQDSYSISRLDGSYINRYKALTLDPTSSFYSNKIFNNAMKIIREGKESEEKKIAAIMIYGYSKHGYCRKAKKIINIMI